MYLGMEPLRLLASNGRSFSSRRWLSPQEASSLCPRESHLLQEDEITAVEVGDADHSLDLPIHKTGSPVDGTNAHLVRDQRTPPSF